MIIQPIDSGIMPRAPKRQRLDTTLPKETRIPVRGGTLNSRTFKIVPINLGQQKRTTQERGQTSIRLDKCGHEGARRNRAAIHDILERPVGRLRRSGLTPKWRRELNTCLRRG